jgi:hypothetical protein
MEGITMLKPSPVDFFSFLGGAKVRFDFKRSGYVRALGIAKFWRIVIDPL